MTVLYGGKPNGRKPHTKQVAHGLLRELVGEDYLPMYGLLREFVGEDYLKRNSLGSWAPTRIIREGLTYLKINI